MSDEVQSDRITDPASSDVWELLCAGLPLLGVLFALNVVLLVLLVAIFPFTDPGSGSYYVSLASFGIIGTSLVAIVAVIRKCRRLE